MQFIVGYAPANFFTGHYVVFNSGFCVLKPIFAINEKGVFAAALIKNVVIGQR